MSGWLQNRFKEAEGLLEAVDRTAKVGIQTRSAGVSRSPSGLLTASNGRQSPSSEAGSGKKTIGADAADRKAATASRFSEGQLQEAPASSSEFGKPSPPKKRISRVSSSTLPPDVPLVPQVLSSKDTAQPAEADLSTSAKSSPNRAESSVSMKSPNAPSKSPGLSLEAKDSQTQSNVSDRENLAGENATISASNATLTAVEPPDVPEEKVGEDVEVPESSRAATHSRSVSLSGGLENSNNSMPNTSDAVAKAIREAAERAGDPDDGTEGTAKEARLSRMVDSMKKKLDQLRSENQQLEELLRLAETASHGTAGDISRLEDDLAIALSEGSASKAELIKAREEWNREAASLRKVVEESRLQHSRLQSQLNNTTERSERMIQEQEASETRMLTALRAEVAEAEQRLEDERFAAASTRQAFSAREHELEATLAESAAALATQQRIAEAKSQRLSSAEQRAGIAESQSRQLRDEVEALEEQMRRLETDGATQSQGNQGIQEVEERAASLQAALSNSESKRAGLEREVVSLRSDLDQLRKNPPNSISSLEQERRLREVTDLLYEKQSLLERLSAERSAQQLSFEQQLGSLRTDAEKGKRRLRSDRNAGPLEDGLVVSLEEMGGYQKLANNKRVGKAVKAGARMLDQTTLTAIRFLRQYPVGRLLVVAYIVVIHLFVYALMHHLQQKAIDVHPLRLDDG